ncbi:MAG: nucleotide-binding protein [Candidatus Woesearchaeota archaeon]|nr:nucleotide-binding protein [Candidatus Woesearchaeota archaeon]
MARSVILDTNMLLVPGQFNVDIFAEVDRVMEEPYELVVLEGTISELVKIEQTGSGEDKRAARLGKLLVEHKKKAADGNCKGLKIIESSETHVDDAILSIAEDDTLVATNDKELKRRLLEHGVRVIFLKQEQYLTVSA